LPLWNGPTSAMHRGPVALVPFCAISASLLPRDAAFVLEPSGPERHRFRPEGGLARGGVSQARMRSCISAAHALKERMRVQQWTPSPLAGEGWGRGSCDQARHCHECTTPTPIPSPQGGGEETAALAFAPSASASASAPASAAHLPDARTAAQS